MKIISLLKSIFPKRKKTRVKERITEIIQISAPFLSVAANFWENILEKNVPVWDIANSTLQKYLGYVTGLIEGATYELGRSEYDDLATDLILHMHIAKRHAELSGVDIFLQVNRISLDCRFNGGDGSGFIGGMQAYSEFSDAQMSGGMDFFEFLRAEASGRKGYYPKRMLELGEDSAPADRIIPKITAQNPKNALENLIFSMYGNPPPVKTADCGKAIKTAYEDLLLELVAIEDITKTAAELYSSQIPYSTNDLALSIALSFFKEPARIKQLSEVQMVARLSLIQWIEDKSVNVHLAKAFEETLYKLYGAE